MTHLRQKMLDELQRRSKDSRFVVPATMPVIASTGAMLTCGHAAPMKVSAIACRIGSRIRVAKSE